MNIKKFDDLNLSAMMLDLIEKRGYTEPTQIQSEAIPIVLEGFDFIGQSQTGTGKTMAFSIPIIEKLDRKSKKIQALILCPTRELAVQVSNEINMLCNGVNISSLAIYGGESIDKQIKALKKNHQIIVGTPGRMLDHIRRKTIKIDEVKFVVLDEADEMLDMGFIEDIELILDEVPEERQSMLFSATLPSEILELSTKYLNEPKFIKASSKQITVEKIQQYYLKVRNIDKMEVLSRLMRIENAKKSIVFCNTKKMVDDLTFEMKAKGFEIEGLHGDMKQQKRDFVMEQFRNNRINVLAATDVAARGLDINDVDIVFNYDLPLDEEQYVHRIGRTARAGKEGKSYSFVFGREIQRLRDIERYSKGKVEEIKIPEISKVQESIVASYVNNLIDNQTNTNKDIYYNIIKQMKQVMNVETFLALVLEERLKITLKDKINYDAYNKKEKTYSEGRSSKKNKAEKGMIRFHINIGRKNGVRASDIVGAVAGECKIKGKEIGVVDIYDKFTFFEVPLEYEKKVLKAMDKVNIKGKWVNVQKSK